MPRIFEKNYRALTDTVAKRPDSHNPAGEWSDDKTRDFRKAIVLGKLRVLAAAVVVAVVIFVVMWWLATWGQSLLLGIVVLPLVVLSLALVSRALTEFGNDIDQLLYPGGSQPAVADGLKSLRLILPLASFSLVFLSLLIVLTSAKFDRTVTFAFLAVSVGLWAIRVASVPASMAWWRNQTADRFVLWSFSLALLILSAILAY